MNFNSPLFDKQSLPYVWRRGRAWRLASFGWPMVSIGWLVIPPTIGVAHSSNFAGIWPAVCLGGIVILVATHARIVGRIEREFLASHGRMCTHCGYDLHPMPRAGECPECGKCFDLAPDVVAWRRAGFFVPSWHKFPPGTTLEAEWKAEAAKPLPPLPAVPPYYKRRTRDWQTVALVVFGIATLISFITIVVQSVQGSWPMTAVISLALVPIIAYGTVAWVGRMPIRREFAAAKGRLCTQCGNKLLGLGDCGRCRRCGNDYDAQRDAEAWRVVGLIVPMAPDVPPQPIE